MDHLTPWSSAVEIVSLFFSSCFSEYDMKENDEEFDAEDLEDNDVAIRRRYVEEDKIIFDTFGNLRGQMFWATILSKNVVRILK